MDILETYGKTDCVYRQYNRGQTCGIGFVRIKVDQNNQINCRNPHYSLVYVASGRVAFTGSGLPRRELGPGMVFQRFPGEPQSSEVLSNDYLEFFLEFDRSFVPMFREHGFPVVASQVWDAGVNPRHLEEIWRLKERLRIAHPLEIGTIVGQMISFVSGMYFCAFQSGGDRNRHGGAIERALRRIHGAEGNSIPDVGALAAEVGLGVDTFRREFRRVAGCTPIAYIINIRIDRACAMLRSKRYSIKEISDSLGYPDIYTFSRQFKKVMGLAPSRF